MKNDKEFVGTLRGFDDYVNIVLDDVTEIENSNSTGDNTTSSSSSSTTTTRKINKLDSILLNGNNIAMLVPGSSPEDAAKASIGPSSK